MKGVLREEGIVAVDDIRRDGLAVCAGALATHHTAMATATSMATASASATTSATATSTASATASASPTATPSASTLPGTGGPQLVLPLTLAATLALIASGLGALALLRRGIS
jgi:Alphavirus glycoprotein J